MHPTEQLHATLQALSHRPAAANPAFQRLLDDYRQYHVVFVVVGGLSTCCLLVLAAVLWRRFRHTAAGGGRWSFERRAACFLGLSTTVAGLLMAVVLAGNITTVADPHPGFAAGVEALRSHAATSGRGQLDRAYDIWLRSGRRQLSPAVARAVDARLAWQRPKAIICGALLVLGTGLAVGLWNLTIRRSRRGRSGVPHQRILVGAGIASVCACLILMLMVIGNTEATVAPIAMTMLYG